MSAVNPTGATPMGGPPSNMKILQDDLASLGNYKTYSPNGRDMQICLQDAKAVGGAMGNFCADALKALQNTNTSAGTGSAFVTVIQYTAGNAPGSASSPPSAGQVMGTFVKGLGLAFKYVNSTKSPDDLSAFKTFVKNLNSNINGGTNEDLVNALAKANQGPGGGTPGLQKLLDNYDFGQAEKGYFIDQDLVEIQQFLDNL